MTNLTNAVMQITSAGEWKRGEIVQLPSGKVARLKKPDVLSMLMDNGRIPDALGPLLVASKQGAQDVEMTPETIISLMPVLNKLTKAAFIEPRVVDQPNDDQLGVEDVESQDKLFLFQWAFGEQGRAASRFRPVETAGVDTVQHGNPNGVKAVPVVGP